MIKDGCSNRPVNVLFQVSLICIPDGVEREKGKREGERETGRERGVAKRNVKSCIRNCLPTIIFFKEENYARTLVF